MINITKKLDKTIKSWLDTKLSQLNEVSPGIFIGGVKDQTSKFPIWLFDCLLYTSPSPRDRG